MVKRDGYKSLGSFCQFSRWSIDDRLLYTMYINYTPSSDKTCDSRQTTFHVDRLVSNSWLGKILKWIKGEEFRKHKEDEELEVVLPNAEWSWEAFFDEENPLSRSPSERLHIWQILSVHGRLSHVVKHELRGKLGLLLCWLSWLRFPHMYDTTLEVPVKVIQQKSCWARSCSSWIFLTCCNIFESWNLTDSWHKV